MISSVFVVYKTDVHHSYASRDLIGIAGNPHEVLGIVRAQADKEGHKLSIDTRFFLIDKKQTQDYEGPGEFQFEEIQLNKLL